MNLLNAIINPFKYLLSDNNSKWDREYENNFNVESINICKPEKTTEITQGYNNLDIVSGVYTGYLCESFKGKFCTGHF